ncbi:MAG: preprotein translocase subunit YajC [Bacteroidales bacterium]|nr:preprotein translocase subunit YajC [Bacteroidales bacterium]
MNMLNILLQAADAAGVATEQRGGGMQMIIMLVLMGVVFYFFMIRPQQKRQKELNEFREKLAKGDKVMTVGGIHGLVSEITETTIIVTIAQGVDIAVEKSCVVADNTDVAQGK